MISTSYPLAEYHASTAISPSKVKWFADEARFPLDYKRRFITKESPRPKPTEACIIGQAFEDLVQRSEDDMFATLAAAEWPKAKRAGTIAAKVEEVADLIRSMLPAVEHLPVFAQLKDRGIIQATFSTVINGVTLQCRPDWWLPNGLDGKSEPCVVDLKSCENLREFIESDITKRRYHWQGHINSMVIRAALKEEYGEAPERVGVYLLPCDKQGLPEAQLVLLPDEYFQLAERDLIGTPEQPGHLRRLMACYQTGVWAGAESEIVAPVPRWMREVLS